MKNLLSAVDQRDGLALAKLMPANTQVDRVVNQAAEQIVDRLFNSLVKVFPAATQTVMKTDADESALKKQWIAAFAENGINSEQAVRAGMAVARANPSPFWPSTGQFIAWCKQGAAKSFGLPDDVELYQMTMKYCRNRAHYSSAEAYPFDNHLCYWLVTDLVAGMRNGNWTDAELRREAGRAIIAMSKRLEAGETIPAPVARLTVSKNVIPLPKERALENIKRLREKFGLKGGAHG